MKKLSKLLCCGLLATAMASTMMPTVHAAPDGWVEPPFDPLPEVVEGKAKFENLTLYAVDMNAYNGKPVGFDTFNLTNTYYLDYHDTVENKQLAKDAIGYFHTTFENLSPDVVDMFLGGELSGETTLKVESKDKGAMNHRGVAVRGVKEGTAKIKCTIYDIENPERTKTEIITLTFQKQVSDEEIMEMKKAKLENISLSSVDTHDFKTQVSLDNYSLNGIYYLDFIDNVENKMIKDNNIHYYHTTFENLSTNVIQIFNVYPGDSNSIIESDATGERPHTGVKVRPIAAGTAKIRYTITDLADKTKTKTEVITITVKKSEDEKDKTTVEFTGKDDIFADEGNIGFALENIFYAAGDVTLDLTLENNPSKLTLPKDLLDAAKGKGIGLSVNVNIGNRTTTWSFPSIDKVMDINLAMNIKDAKEIKGLQTEGLVLSFNHSGELPTGTVVRTYVGDSFKAGEKVQLSYYNETTKKLEETKTYIVDADGYVSVVINHCSDYVLTKADADLTLHAQAAGDDIIKATATSTTANTGIVISIAILLAGGIALSMKKQAKN